MKKAFYPTLFQHLATDYRRNLAVTAGAGTGKTEVLTRRIIKILAQEKHCLDRLLVLTFTDKAAVEMKERIYAAVEKELLQTGMPHFQKIKDTFLNNYISTFHAFCAALLREYPIEARIDPYFRVLDETEKLFFLRRSINRSIKKLAADKNNPDIQLLSEEFSRSHINNAVFTIIQKREEIGPWITDFLNLSMQSYRERLEKYRHCILREISYKLFISGTLQEQLQKLKEIGESVLDFNYSVDRKRKKVVQLLPQFFKEIERIVPETLGETAQFSLGANSAGEGESAAPLDVTALAKIKKEILQHVRLSGSPPKTWSLEAYSELKGCFYTIRYLLESFPIEDFEIGEEHEKEGFKLLKALARLVQYCLRVYYNDKGEENYLDFQDLQLKVLHLLEKEKYSHILDEIRERFLFIMVDEFQDTNDIQWRIVRKIAASHSGDIVNPKVFIVGDEKQAIYSFRGGDVRLFSRARNELKEANRRNKLDLSPFELQLDSSMDYTDEYRKKIEDEQLTRAGEIVFADNFRSAAMPVYFFNMFFHDLLTKDIYEEYDARPQTLFCSGNKTAGSVELLLVDVDESKYDDAMEYLPSAERAGTESKGAAGVELKPHFKEALLIADKIKEVFWGDDEKYRRVRESAQQGQPSVAILLNRRTMLKTYEEALRMNRINFTVVRGRGFFQRQEIVDVGNLLSFLTDPADDLSLVAFLRSPTGHLSDEGIFLLSTTVAGATFWEKLQNYNILQVNKQQTDHFSGEDRQALSGATARLKRWLSLAQRMPLVEFLRLVFNEGGYYVSLSRGIRGEQALSNMEKLLDSARDLTLQDGGDLVSFTEWLNNRIDFIDEEGEADIDISLGGAVQIMTVHQSKGLEFPLVFVPDLAAGFNLGERESLYADYLPYVMAITSERITRREMPEIGINAPNPENEWESEPLLCKRIIKKRLRDKLIAEKKRLFYVAITRAMDHLVLVGHAQFSSDKLIKRLQYMPLDLHNSWLEWLNKILGISMQMKGFRGEIIYSNHLGEALKIPYLKFMEEGALLGAETEYRTDFPLDES